MPATTTRPAEPLTLAAVEATRIPASEVMGAASRGDQAGCAIDAAADQSWTHQDVAIQLPLIAVPVRKVRFLQAMAEDGPGAQPCRSGGEPLQRVIQRTTC